MRIGVPGTGLAGTTIATTLVSLGDEAIMRVTHHGLRVTSSSRCR